MAVDLRADGYMGDARVFEARLGVGPSLESVRGRFLLSTSRQPRLATQTCFWHLEAGMTDVGRPKIGRFRTGYLGSLEVGTARHIMHLQSVLGWIGLTHINFLSI